MRNTTNDRGGLVREKRGRLEDADETYFTYRPLSNLPTPPPQTSKSSTVSSDAASQHEHDLVLDSKHRGPAIHLVNLIPPSASLRTASVPLVQSILSRANLPIETVALAVCVLDSLDTKFARSWRLACPLQSDVSPNLKRHSLPVTPPEEHILCQVHIDSISPEIIVLAALVIAAKFTEDLQEPALYYCRAWGSGIWSHEQLNVTERCIMSRLDYRIMPLCAEDCLTDAMVDMQLAAQQHDWPPHGTQTPPDSAPVSDEQFVPSHQRSKTVGTTCQLSR